jgi:hypothetical protein
MCLEFCMWLRRLDLSHLDEDQKKENCHWTWSLNYSTKCLLCDPAWAGGASKQNWVWNTRLHCRYSNKNLLYDSEGQLNSFLRPSWFVMCLGISFSLLCGQAWILEWEKGMKCHDHNQCLRWVLGWMLYMNYLMLLVQQPDGELCCLADEETDM